MIEQIATQVISVKDRIRYGNELLTYSSLPNRINYMDKSFHKDEYKDEFLNIIDRMIFQKWYTKITLVIHKEFSLTVVVLVDSDVDMNCIQEGLIPSKYYESTTDKLTQTDKFEIDLKDYKSTYNFAEISDRFKPSKPITITDLQIDINNLRKELK